MYVITVDQRDSTRTGDKVASLLGELADWQRAQAVEVVLPFERTVGDEIQAVLSDPSAALDIALVLQRHLRWSVGIGAGPVEMPLAVSARASSGRAFLHARRAVERARSRGEAAPVVVEGENGVAADSATALLQLLAGIVRRRSTAGWEVADLLKPGVTQRDVATRLGVSEQAVSQRTAAAMLAEERGARPVAAALIAAAGGVSPGSGILGGSPEQGRGL